MGGAVSGARRAPHQQVSGRIADDRRSGRLHAEGIAEVDDHVGRWLHRDPVVRAHHGLHGVRHAEGRQRAKSGLAVVAGRDGDAPSGGAKAGEQGAQVGERVSDSDRIRRVPSAGQRSVGLVPGEATQFEQVAGLLAQARHRGRGEAATVPDRPRRRVEPEHREERFVEASPGAPAKSGLADVPRWHPFGKPLVVRTAAPRLITEQWRFGDKGWQGSGFGAASSGGLAKQRSTSRGRMLLYPWIRNGSSFEF